MPPLKKKAAKLRAVIILIISMNVASQKKKNFLNQKVLSKLLQKGCKYKTLFIPLQIKI